jgi:hypothetical protein
VVRDQVSEEIADFVSNRGFRVGGFRLRGCWLGRGWRRVSWLLV